MSNYYAIFFNQNLDSNLKDKNIRLALTQAIDKKRIIREAFDNQAIEIDQSYDTTKTLDFSAIKDKKLEFDIIVPQIDFLIKTAEIIKENWAAIGVKLNTLVLNPSDIINLVIRQRDYKMILFGINPKNKEDLFSFWHSSQKFYPGLNLAVYGNSEADKLMEEIRQTAESNERQSKLKTLQNLINQDIPVIFLYSPKYLYVSINDLGGFEDKLINTVSDRFQNVKNWYVETSWIFK